MAQATPAPQAPSVDLSAWLESARLSHYEDALRGLGCMVPEDLAELEEADLMEIGMKRIEAKRLLRVAGQ